MADYKLEVQSRDTSVAAKNIRAEGMIPGVLYGEGVENVDFQMDYQGFRRIYRDAGGNSIIDLDVNGKKFKVLVHQVDFDPVTDKMTHVDFINIRMDKEITAKVPLEFIGQSPAVANLDGVLTHGQSEVEIKCLPGDLIHSIEVDVSSLEDFHTSISVGDLTVPETVTILDDPELPVASVSAPREEEEEEIPVEGEEGEEGEAAEGEEGAEGEKKEEGGDKEEGGGKEGE